jgi:beta-lactamase regulating signal transducer with metallopeptidase domain
MMSNVVHSLIIATLVSSVAVLIVGLLRKPLRYTVGCRAAYWIWLLAPVITIASLLPGPSELVQVNAKSLPPVVNSAYSAVMVSMDATWSSSYTVGIVVVWLISGFLMILWALKRQRRFVRSLGELTLDSQGFYRSQSVTAPLLMGVWNARIVVPENFEDRYSPKERALVLAHERAHLERQDVAIYVFATAWLCLAWFNPLIYWALGRLRFDQELACDEQVLAASQTPRRIYAEALLKTQLANESARRLPAGCHWQSIHPLQERIAMLKLHSPGLARRLGGIAFAVGVTLAGSYAVWAAQAELPSAAINPTAGNPTTSLIAIHMKWWATGKGIQESSGPLATQDIRVASGNEFVERVSFAPGQSYETRCFASLSNEDRPSPVWAKAKAVRKNGTDGLILLECKLSNDDKVFSTPALLVGEGRVGTIETSNLEGSVHYKLEFNASTQAARAVVAK